MTRSRSSTAKLVQEEAQLSRHRSVTLHSKNWLDVLPIEVCSRLAVHVDSESFVYDGIDHKSSSSSLPSLAEVSEKQRTAVLEYLSYRLGFPHEDDGRWLSIFRNEFKSVRIGYYFPGSQNRPVVSLLSAPSLRSADVENRSTYLRAVSNASCVSELTVRFAENSPLRSFFNALKKLNLTKLSLRCFRSNTWLPLICVTRDLFEPEEARNRLAALCPNLESLDVSCACVDGNTESTACLVPEMFPNLRELTINRPLPQASIPYLRRLDSITLRNFRQGSQIQCKFASVVGSPVVAIEDAYLHLNHLSSPGTGEVVRCSEAALLQACPRLQKLELFIERGAENELPHFRELHTLQLHWEGTVVEDDQAPENRRERYYAPSQSFFRRIAESAVSVKVLYLLRARIDRESLLGMLRALGHNLRAFGASVTDQEESPCQRIDVMLRGAIQHAPLLERLQFGGSSFLVPDRSSFEVKMYWRTRILHGLNVLHRRAPQLDVTETLADLLQILDRDGGER